MPNIFRLLLNYHRSKTARSSLQTRW